MAMGEYVPVTDDDLARARRDPAFRQKLLTDNLDRLLAELKKLRRAKATDSTRAQQIKEGVQLAVILAERIQTLASGRSGVSRTA
jgi:hypothetical protein